MRGFLHTLKRLFLTLDEEDVELKAKGGRGSDNRSDGGDLDVDDEGRIKPGKRSNRWYKDISDSVDENTERSIENKNYLVRLDYRTVWIMRLLVALITTVGGAVVLQILGL